MSKDYLCKNCEQNNNGWCKKYKKNGLKTITECDSFPLEIEKKVDTEACKQFGRRHILHDIQMQMYALDNDSAIEDKDKFKTLKQLIVNLETIQTVNEGIFGIELEFMVDEDMYNNSKSITDIWEKSVGKYESKK